MAARDVVPQTAEPRGFLRRRKTDEPPLPASPSEPAPVQQSDELFRAQAALLQAALRQADDLTAALVHEQQLRRQETERLTAENQLLRDALATLNAQALERQREVAAASALDLILPEQRDHVTAEHPQDVPAQQLDTAHRHGHRRSARQAGPA